MGCKIQFWKHWDQSQPCSSNGFRATAVCIQGGNLAIVTVPKKAKKLRRLIEDLIQMWYWA